MDDTMALAVVFALVGIGLAIGRVASAIYALAREVRAKR